MKEGLRANVLDAASDAWRWWTDELADMVPRAWRVGAGEANILLSYQSVRVERRIGDMLEIHADERAIEDLDDEGWSQLVDLVDGLSTQIILENPLCWTGTVTLPKAARSRLRTAVELQLPHAAPVKEELLVWRAEVRQALGDELDIAVPMAKRALIETLDAGFASLGLRTPPILVRAPDGDRHLRPGVRRIVREPQNSDRILIGAGALIAAAPMLTAVLAIFLTSMNRDRIEALRVKLEPKIAAEEAWRRDEAIRREIAVMSKAPPMSDILARLDARVPEKVQLTSLGLEQGARLSVTARADSAATVQQAFASDPSLAALKAVAEVPQDGSLFLVTFEGGSR